jgi:hypothetical protein
MASGLFCVLQQLGGKNFELGIHNRNRIGPGPRRTARLANRLRLGRSLAERLSGSR